MYKIIGRMKQDPAERGKRIGRNAVKLEFEEIDEAATKAEADYLLGEYRLAYGPDWILKKVEVKEEAENV